ncbi:unnamed protein product [Allacma fusca]|uniref:EF-hand domain-containing protein n=1 Tax=Allacma fusca TaxID=39272 RepID=A0A8J2LRT0_9HEXA|nr:unnamed protein product [Allacma fusca]
MDPKKLYKDQHKDHKKLEKKQEKNLKDQEKEVTKQKKEPRKNGVGVGHSSIQTNKSAMSYQQPHHPGAGGVDPQLAQWFTTVDQDRSGRISAAELQGALMSSTGQKFSESVCHLMIGMFDSGTGSIDINGFQHLCQYVNQGLNAFRSFDSDQSGYINSQELSSALQIMGYRLSLQFVNILTTRFGDRRGKGLPVNGFIMSCILIQKFTESFRQRDIQQQGVITIAYEDFLSLILISWTYASS